MSVKNFDCNKIKRTFWTFTMKDKKDENDKVIEKGKKLIVRMPQKKVFEAIQALENVDEDNATVEDTNSVYELMAAVLNNNMSKTPVTIEDIKDYDIEECTAILEAYMEFVNELKTNPN
ncbi:MAG: hypothetical protein IJN64_10830 [Lachnospiraceae bacterium]|nr:hypothetical protein [Lachnospiraceae bacterium]